MTDNIVPIKPKREIFRWCCDHCESENFWLWSDTSIQCQDCGEFSFSLQVVEIDASTTDQ